jgi:hypothetical protein
MFIRQGDRAFHKSSSVRWHRHSVGQWDSQPGRVHVLDSGSIACLRRMVSLCVLIQGGLNIKRTLGSARVRAVV